jgi:hypothetical protein
MDQAAGHSLMIREIGRSVHRDHTDPQVPIAERKEDHVRSENGEMEIID